MAGGGRLSADGPASSAATTRKRPPRVSHFTAMMTVSGQRKALGQGLGKGVFEGVAPEKCD